MFLADNNGDINIATVPRKLGEWVLKKTVYLLVSLLVSKMSVQVLGAIWYLFAFERQYTCWKRECKKEQNLTDSPSCNQEFLDCSSIVNKMNRRAWLAVTKVLTNCDARDNPLDFGMFADAFTSKVASVDFTEKYFYCLWFGLRGLRYVFFFLDVR